MVRSSHGTQIKKTSNAILFVLALNNFVAEWFHVHTEAVHIKGGLCWRLLVDPLAVLWRGCTPGLQIEFMFECAF